MTDVLSEFNKWKETYTEISKSIDPLEELYLNDIISEEIFEKARTGKYSDTAENRRLKRVGQEYGKKKGEDTKEEKEGKKEPETDKKQGEEKSIEEHARNASEQSLINASKGGDEEHRKAAKAELDRREKEESPKGENKDLVEVKKKAEKTLNGLSLNHAVSALESEDFKDLSKEDKIEIWNKVKNSIIKQSELMRRKQDIPDWYNEAESNIANKESNLKKENKEEVSSIDELNEKIEGELNNQDNPLNEINEKIEKEVNSKEEKAPKDHVTYKTPIGQKITRSDGKKFEKVAHTGDISKDWKEIKEETKKEEPKKEEKKEGKVKNYQTFTGNVQETVDFYKKDVEKTGEEMLKLVSGKSTTISDSAINTLSILGAVTTPLDMINLFRDKEFQKKILGDLTEATFQEKEEGKNSVNVSDFSKQDKESPYMSADITTPETKGHVSIKEMEDKTATIADIQIGYEGKEGRGKGYGTDAYIEIGKKLAEKGITLESTNWEKHGTAISPQALKVWEKLEKQGYAKKIGEKEGKVLNRESGEEEVKKLPLYSFVSKGNDIEKSEQDDIFEKARSGTYSDTPENKKLGRVGQKYGSKKEEEVKSSENETIDSLKEEYKTALEGNDFDKLAEIHKKLTEKSKNEEKNYSSLIDGLTKDFKKVMQESMSDDFSDESKTMELSRKTKELSRYLQIASGFSEERTEKDSKTLSSYFNLSEDKIKDIFGDGDILGLQIKEEGDTLKVVSVTEDCFVKRYFNKKDNSVKMEELFLNPSLKKGEGVGINIFSNQITKYKELGFDELKVMAASGENLNGGYTWARVGYDFDKSSDTYIDDYHQFTEILKTSGNKEIKKSKNLQELLSTDEGIKFWKKNHFTFSGSFDLKDSSKNMEVYNAYMDEKRNR